MLTEAEQETSRREKLEPWERDFARLENEVRDMRTELRHLDERGTRGILPLTVQMNELVKDVAKLEMTTDRMQNMLDRRLPSTNWRQFLAFAAVLAPVYAFMVQQLTQGVHP